MTRRPRGAHAPATHGRSVMAGAAGAPGGALQEPALLETRLWRGTRGPCVRARVAASGCGLCTFAQAVTLSVCAADAQPSRGLWPAGRRLRSSCELCIRRRAAAYHGFSPCTLAQAGTGVVQAQAIAA